MSYQPYEPLNCLKPITDNIWLVDGPIVEMSYVKVLSIPFPTRMTIIRLSGGRLVVHSPTLLTADLKTSVDALGKVAFLLSPNRIHYVYLNSWKEAYPEAQVWAAPDVRENVPDVAIDNVFGEDGAPDWGDEMRYVLVPGSYMTELEIFHNPSRTLVLTDLIENFEEDREGGTLMKIAMKCGGVVDPNGSTPRDLRQTFSYKHKRTTKQAVEKMIAWGPERVIIAHGRWYEKDGTRELKRAFGWLLK